MNPYILGISAVEWVRTCPGFDVIVKNSKTANRAVSTILAAYPKTSRSGGLLIRTFWDRIMSENLKADHLEEERGKRAYNRYRPGDLVPISVAAEELGCGYQTLYQRTRAGTLSVYNKKGKKMVSLAEAKRVHENPPVRGRKPKTRFFN